jgi:hypothetical protein
MDRTGIEQAAKLLAKAASTDSDAESIALCERSYRLLAQAITAWDVENGQFTFGPEHGGRERRLVPDRRAPRVVHPLPGPDRAHYAPSLYSQAAVTHPAEPPQFSLEL